MTKPMTAAELAAELAHAHLVRRPVILSGAELALVARLVRDEAARDADTDALAEQVYGGPREEDDHGY